MSPRAIGLYILLIRKSLALVGLSGSTSVYSVQFSVKTKIQADAISTKGLKGKQSADINLSILSLLVRIYHEEGIAGYYRGFGASMLNTFSMRSSSLSFISNDCN